LLARFPCRQRALPQEKRRPSGAVSSDTTDQRLRKSSWQALHDPPAAPTAALMASMLPVLAATASLPTSSSARAAAALNLSCSCQTSGCALPPSVPGPNPTQGCLI